jgi:hypothetical protein
MTDEMHSPTTAGPTPDASQPAAAPASSASGPQSLPAEHPELLAGAAFAGGLLAAMILRRIAS